jgi:hypothetical protein
MAFGIFNLIISLLTMIKMNSVIYHVMFYQILQMTVPYLLFYLNYFLLMTYCFLIDSIFKFKFNKLS